MQKLSTIDVKAFRGIRNLSINLNKKSLIIKGDNGTGKSSIVDAIEFFFVGNLSQFKGIQKLNFKKYGPHVLYNENDSKVTITFDGDKNTYYRTGIEALQPSQELKILFETVARKTFILRRFQLLNFINSKPVDRFHSISSIIGLEVIEKRDLELKRLLDNLTGKKSANENEISTKFLEFSKILNKSVHNEHMIIKEVNVLLKNLEFKELPSLLELNTFIQNLIRKYSSLDINVSKIADLTRIKEISNIEIPDLSLIGKINTQIDKINKEKILHYDKLTQFLVDGHYYLHQEKNKCPFCEQSVEFKSLSERINSRISITKELSSQASYIRRNLSEVSTKFESFLISINNLINTLNNTNFLYEEKNILIKRKKLLNSIVEEIQNDNIGTKINDKELSEIFEDINKILTNIRNKTSSDLNKLKPNQNMKIANLIDILARIDQKHSELTKTELKFIVISKQYTIIDKIYNIFDKVKRNEIQNIFNKMNSTINMYYDILHPEENHKNIKLSIVRRISTELTIDSFERQGEDPRGFSSEGHLDSIGLCIFLAFMKEFNKETPIIILDDIVTTIDANHRNKICDLLFKEFKDRQLIITTHDNVWFDQLKRSLETFRLSSEFIPIEISSWSINQGPVLIPSLFHWNKIQFYLKNNDYTSVGNLTRQYFERLLKQVCENFHVKVDFKLDARYEIFNLFDPACTKISKLINNQELKTLLNNIKRNRVILDSLSHDNPTIQYSHQEIKEFMILIKKFETHMTCKNCPRLIKYDFSGILQRCKCQK